VYKIYWSYFKLKMEATGCYKMLVPIYKATRRHVPNINLQWNINSCDN